VQFKREQSLGPDRTRTAQPAVIVNIGLKSIYRGLIFI
jgi:hypothetical protein